MHGQLTDSRLTILNANGHCPHLSEPAETVKAMKKYLWNLGGLGAE
jgi:sigma-B regulation protein RsbQ